MKLFEVSSRKSKNGRRKIKVILHEIYSDDCVNETTEAGEMFNDNGITWIREYCEEAIPTIKDMSLRVEFVDELNRVEILGHGNTGIQDGLPLFEDADVVGHFTNAYIDEITDADGNIKTVLIGEAYIDEMCYPGFVQKLIEDTENDNAPHGSVEIYRTDDNDGIVYKYGYKDKGRIPMKYIYSGYALLGIRPADKTAKLLEINEFGKEETTMNENEVKALIADTVNEMMSASDEMNKCKEECASQVALAEQIVAEKNALIEELNAKISDMQSELENCKNEKDELCSANEAMKNEINSLKCEVENAKANERKNELNSAISSFSDEEKAYAKDEIDAFNANPIESEINSVVTKIWEGIGRKAKEVENVLNEQNSAKSDIEDIFAEVVSATAVEDTDIF